MKHLKQKVILAIANTVLIVTVSVPNMANAMPIHMVKNRSISNHYQFDKETIHGCEKHIQQKYLTHIRRAFFLWDKDK